ncbi:transmembrane protein 229A-like [Mizuhopecten yessoensis]|uniref:Transmembrane protein 229A n=1 Tax=Mizuhopecten yessoensis TaxID=6573 RepID=A0A210Q0Q2_MIZYE|nr:transmembrane protein 229A-like [Mizuhopecten yessoensis]XP_021370286.1 transmembrane protein 229A-like [Mizuhopecten yessoensis]XP_021370287.1 transmembrane protein 229A-like [Mizuhopecten yessoensis]OWF42334.1 Transmembrane protein 229A [Mizuhopecten yessoensis]
MTTTQNRQKAVPAWIRFYFYGMHGLLDEIVFTALFDMVFEPSGNRSLKGQSSIFSFFIYGSCSFLVEQLYVFLYLKHGVPRYIRLFLYLCILYTWEFGTGLLLRQFGACSWDYSHYKYNVMGLITLEYAPGWLILCFLQDVFADFLLSLSININAADTSKGKKSS